MNSCRVNDSCIIGKNLNGFGVFNIGYFVKF